MSMSTGDVRRPSLSKLAAKAAATDKPEPDVIDSDDSDIEATDEDTDLTEDENAETTPIGRGADKARTAGGKASGNRGGAAKTTGTKISGTKVTVPKAGGATGAKTTAAKAAGVKTAPAKAGAKTVGARPSGARPNGRGPVRGGGGKGRKPSGPIKVKSGLNWGPIAMFGAAGLLALAIVGFGAYSVYKDAHK